MSSKNICLLGQRLKSRDHLTMLTMSNNRPGRPASIRTRNFRRRLSDADAAILAHAGDGDVSAGFRNLIDWYWQSVNDAKTNERSCYKIKPEE